MFSAECFYFLSYAESEVSTTDQDGGGNIQSLKKKRNNGLIIRRVDESRLEKWCDAEQH